MSTEPQPAAATAPVGPHALVDALYELASNYRWVWDEPTQDLFRALNAEEWDRFRDPFALLRDTPAERFGQLAAERDYPHRVAAAQADLARYLADTPEKPEVAYFCMEYGIAPQLRVYAGGLGMLAGCIAKTASDLAVPMVAIGLLYRSWPRQQLRYGWQHEQWETFDPNAAGLQPCPDIEVHVELADQQVAVRVWRAKIGRVDLYLLDTDTPQNPPELRGITDRLYGGDAEHRLRQEVVLGVGGVRVLDALGPRPTVFHANEGHAGFMGLERIRRAVAAGDSLDRAMTVVRAGTVFTTHTAVPAGFDLFGPDLMYRYFGKWAAEVGVGVDWLLDLGHFPGQQRSEPFNMAVLCARLSGHINAVSRLHREVTEQRVLGPLWPGRAAPIVPVTNGVHPRTWTPPELAALFERYVGPDWDYAGPDAWQGVWDMPDDELWQVRQRLRASLVEHVRWYLPRTLRQQGWTDDLGWAETALDPNGLTVVVARRAAEYKETDLLVSCPDRLRALVGDPARPANIIFAGLAHPKDDGGKERIRRIVEFSLGADVRSRVLFLPGYDMRLAMALLGGADVWLNHPRRGDEACGTSFMKSVFAGGRVLTTADGGADELLIDGDNGWILGDRHEGAGREALAGHAFGLLEGVIMPEFHQRGADGVPTDWVDGIRRSLASLAWQVSSGPMVRAYGRLYRDADRRSRRLMTHR